MKSITFNNIRQLHTDTPSDLLLILSK